MKNKLLLFSALFLFIAGAGNAQIKNIYNFTGNEDPQGSLTQSGNLFYGMAYAGGDSGRNEGYIFVINRNGSGFKQIWNFYDTGVAFHANGENPTGSLIINGNKLYGMTEQGGANGYGLVFSINTDGSGYKDLWDFNDTANYAGNSNGEYPYGGLVLLRGRLYGMTNRGGYHSSYLGLIFSVDTAGGGFKDMLDFSQTLNGGNPYGDLIISGGKFLGMTYGNCDECRTLNGEYGWGNVFSMDTNGTNYKDVYVFAGPNGIGPSGSLAVSQDGKRVYGTTGYSGPKYNDGIVFGVDTDGGNFKNLMSFNDSNGRNSYGSLILSGKTLYGMTNEGGSYLQYSGSGFGNIFSLDTNGSNPNVVYNFNLSNGANPLYGHLTIEGDTLYGMTEYGGFEDDGVIFAYTIPTVTTGIQNISYTNGNITVYPNPSNGVFTIKSAISGQWSVDVYNLLGEKVYTQSNIQNQTFNIDLGSQSNGIYFYRVTNLDGNNVGEGKLEIQK